MKATYLARTEYMVLRKTPHKESSLIIAGISPCFGRLDFVARGAKKISKTSLPFVDVFREITVEFDTRAEGLQTLRLAEFSESFDGVADRPRNYEAACLLGAFLLKVSRGHLECPLVYRALKVALGRLASEDGAFRVWPSLVRLVCLHENGLVPDRLYEEDDDAEEEKRRRLLEAILSAALGERGLPSLSPEYFDKLSEWTDGLCRENGLE